MAKGLELKGETLKMSLSFISIFMAKTFQVFKNLEGLTLERNYNLIVFCCQPFCPHVQHYLIKFHIQQLIP